MGDDWIRVKHMILTFRMPSKLATPADDGIVSLTGALSSCRHHDRWKCLLSRLGLLHGRHQPRELIIIGSSGRRFGAIMQLRPSALTLSIGLLIGYMCPVCTWNRELFPRGWK